MLFFCLPVSLKIGNKYERYLADCIMDDLSLDSDGGGEVDRDECDESTLASAFPSSYQELASVSVALEKVYVLGLARSGDQACAGLDSGKVSVHSLETLVRSASLSGHKGSVTGVVASLTGNSTLHPCSMLIFSQSFSLDS